MQILEQEKKQIELKKQQKSQELQNYDLKV